MDRAVEVSLVDRLRAHDPAAFDEVYEAYRARLFSFLVRLCHQRDLAEDLLEEVWLRLVAHARRLEPDTRLAAWLFTVARNVYWSHCRSRLVAVEHGPDAVGLWVQPAPRSSPFEEVAAGELERRVERALGTLPPSHREVLLLVAVDELTPSEAATVCGISPEALRKRLSRARAMLGDALREQELGPKP